VFPGGDGVPGGRDVIEGGGVAPAIESFSLIVVSSLFDTQWKNFNLF